MEAYSLDSRPVDGTGTNEDNPDWGASNTELLRLADSDLGPMGEMSGADRPNPREVSNAVAQQVGDMPNAFGASDFLWIWGQFIDHDLSLTEAGSTVTANIEVPVGDPYFDPFGTGGVVIPFSRVDLHDGVYVNEITAFLDASMIYGSDAETVAKMRVDGGKLLMTEDAQLMLEGANFLTGDIRAAENVALSSMHTIFTREHNRIVDELAAEDPMLTDDQLFETARAHVEGIVQAITFNDFLPMLVGDGAIAAYRGYDSAVNPGISVEFSTAVYRLGHTLLSANLQLVAEDGTAKSPLALRDAFFRPSLLTEEGLIEDVLRGAATQHAQALDARVVEDVRSFLFGPPGAGGFDLAALNIQRGRDLGVASYNDLREVVGLARAETFDDITSDATLAAQLEALYGDTDKVDAWIGGLAEDAVGDGMLGALFATVLINQFMCLRDGDPFWSEGREGLSDDMRDMLWDTTLADVILRNTDVEAIQKDVFVAMNRMVGTTADEAIRGTQDADFIFGDDGGDILSGLSGHDDMQGGNGADLLRGHKGDDCLDGGMDNDTLRGGTGEDTLLGGEGDDTLRGGSDSDDMDGGDGDDQLRAGAGDDLLLGMDGADTLRGDAGDDILKGGDGDDVLRGGDGDDVLMGEAGNDTLRSTKGNDMLDGGDGDDYLIAGAGNTILTGGDGADCFVFYTRDLGSNTITDYDSDVDVYKIRTAPDETLFTARLGDDLRISIGEDASIGLAWGLTIEDYFL